MSKNVWIWWIILKVGTILQIHCLPKGKFINYELYVFTFCTLYQHGNVRNHNSYSTSSFENSKSMIYRIIICLEADSSLFNSLGSEFNLNNASVRSVNEIDSRQHVRISIRIVHLKLKFRTRGANFKRSPPLAWNSVRAIFQPDRGIVKHHLIQMAIHLIRTKKANGSKSFVKSLWEMAHSCAT